MPRARRKAPGGLVYHVLNRANGRLRLFKKEEDFRALERVLLEAWKRVPIRILGWCIMSNHWHLVLWPAKDGQLSRFVGWLTLTHAQRWKQAHAAVGAGHLYQGRFKSFPIEEDEHLLSVLRYVERNPLRAGMVRRAQDWAWSSLRARGERSHALHELLSEWPVERPAGWVRLVNSPQSDVEEAAMREHIARNRPLGSEVWEKRMGRALELEQTMRARGRQKGWRKSKRNRTEK
jgi:putative transposase